MGVGGIFRTPVLYRVIPGEIIANKIENIGEFGESKQWQGVSLTLIKVRVQLRLCLRLISI